MVSSASAQIETTGGNNIRTATGEPDYAKVSAILIGVVAAWIIGCCLIGSEAHGAHFERGKAAFEKGGGRDERQYRSLLKFPHRGSGRADISLIYGQSTRTLSSTTPLPSPGLLTKRRPQVRRRWSSAPNLRRNSFRTIVG